VAGLLALPLGGWLARAGGWPALGNALSLAVVAAALAALIRGAGARAATVTVVAALVLGALAAWLRLPPVYWPAVAINLALAGLFAASLFRGEPLIARFARRETGILTAEAERYCRRLTVAWAAWLALLAAAGVAIAAHGDERLGAWWCGAIDYLLVAALFVGELAYRRARGAPSAGLVAQVRNVRGVLRERRG
jgi:uncharacterized membrane protein